MTLHIDHRARLLGALLVLSGCAGAPVRESTPSATDIRAIPKIDVHAHYRTNHPDLVPALAAWNARAVLVNVTGSERRIDEKWRDFVALRAAHPDRFFLVATFDPFRFDEPDFVARTIEQLHAQIAAGAKGVKVWKDIGMDLKDAQGHHVQIDHPRFQAIWDFLSERGILVIAHIAEPLVAMQPLLPLISTF